MTILGKNKKAYFDYQILKEYEAGIVLKGWEVKSIKEGSFSLKESYVDVRKSEAWVYGMHINVWKFANRTEGLSEVAPRKLLLNRQEIDSLMGQVKQKGFSIVPLDIHLNHGVIKIQIGLAKGKQMGDKRERIKEREQKREIDRDLKHAGY